MPGYALEEVQGLLRESYEFLDGHIRGLAMAGFLGLDELKALARGAVKAAVIAGGAAGAHTVSGIAVGDQLRAVLSLDFTLAEGAPNIRTWAVSDLTGEFSITAAGTISNAGGTDTTGGVLVVVWEDWTP